MSIGNGVIKRHADEYVNKMSDVTFLKMNQSGVGMLCCDYY